MGWGRRGEVAAHEVRTHGVSQRVVSFGLGGIVQGKVALRG